MNKILAIDTSGPAGIIAASAAGITSTLRFGPGKSSRTELAAHCARVLSEIGISAGELTYLAAGVGPGRFIRTRVGVSFINGMASALRLPIVPIDSLAVLACCCIGDMFTVGALREDAKGGYVFSYSLYNQKDSTFDPANPWRFPPKIVSRRALFTEISAKASLWAIDGDEENDEKTAELEKSLAVAKVYGEAKAKALLELAEAGVKLNRLVKVAIPLYAAELQA